MELASAEQGGRDAAKEGRAGSSEPAQHRRARWRGARQLLTALVVQGAAVVWLTWPLAAGLATERPGRALVLDSPLVAWALASETRALAGERPLAATDIYHPTPNALFYGEPGFGALPFFAPAFLATGNPTLALNLTFLLPIVLTAACLQLVAWRWTGSLLAGVLGGWVFLHAPWVLRTWVPSAPNYAVLFYLPLLMYLLADPAPRAMRLGAVLVLAVLQSLVSPYLAAAVAIPLGSVAALRLLEPGRRRTGAWLAAALALLAGTVVLAYGPSITVHRLDPGLSARSVWWYVPLPFPVPRGYWNRWVPTMLPLAGVAVAIGGLAVRALARTRGARAAAWRHAALWVALGVVFSLPPHIFFTFSDARFGPVSRIPGTWGVIAWVLPTASRIRVPMRLGVLALVGASVAAALGWRELGALAARLARRFGAARWLQLAGAGTAFVAVLAAVHLPASEPYPVVAVRDPHAGRVMQALRAAPEQGAVLELPLATPRSHADAMYRAVVHGRPLLNGYSGYWPEGFERRMQLACQLPAVKALQALVREADLAFVIVNRAGWRQRKPAAPPNGCPAGLYGPERWQLWLHFAERGVRGLSLLARDKDRLLFRVDRARLGPAARGG